MFFLTSFYAKNVFTVYNVFRNFFFAHENMKKPASKVAELAQIQPKSQFLFHKNLPPRDFSKMTLIALAFWRTIVSTQVCDLCITCYISKSACTQIKMRILLSKSFKSIVRFGLVWIRSVLREDQSKSGRLPQQNRPRALQSLQQYLIVKNLQ